MLRTLCCVILLIVQRDTESTRVIGGWRTVLLGEDVDLSCRLIETDEELEQITWQKSTLEETQNHNFMLINPNGVTTFISPNGLTGRVQFIGNPSENLGSIRITAVRLLDEGTFKCIFSVFPSGTYNTEIPLTVLDESEDENPYRITHQPRTKRRGNGQQQQRPKTQDSWTWEEILDGRGPWAKPGEYSRPKVQQEKQQHHKTHGHGRTSWMEKDPVHSPVRYIPAPRIGRARVGIEPGKVGQARCSRAPVHLHGPVYPVPPPRTSPLVAAPRTRLCLRLIPTGAPACPEPPEPPACPAPLEPPACPAPPEPSFSPEPLESPACPGPLESPACPGPL
uniref:Ig-like domain-containing protein n=1 Tax=Oncorhynchus tshawytscha TaxID=74940 RepID=A0A8C8I3F1_ONCTS